MIFENRIDYILVWGHGMPFFEEIRTMIREDPSFRIRKILFHRPKSIRKLVNVVYSYDYAPLEHLKSKTRYLLRSPAEVAFVFLENLDPMVDYFGEGAFRHEESTTLKALKERIRDRFNPRIDGKRTENHVIHASDSSAQTDYILKYLSFPEGVKMFETTEYPVKLPYYIKNDRNIKIRRLPLSDLTANIVVGENRYDYTIVPMELEETPHYKGLTKNIEIYDDYIKRFLGGPLTEDYHGGKLLELYRNMRYLGKGYENCFVVVKRKGSRYVVMDGLHRASVLLARREKEIIVAEMV